MGSLTLILKKGARDTKVTKLLKGKCRIRV